MTFHRISTLAVATIALVAVAGSAGSAKEERAYFYTPTVLAASAMGVRNAMRIIKGVAPHAWFKTADGSNLGGMDEIVIEKGSLTIYYEGKKRRKLTFSLLDIDPRLVNVKVPRSPDFVGIETTAGAPVVYWLAPKVLDPELFTAPAARLKPAPDPAFPGPTLRQVSDAFMVLTSRASLISGPAYARKFDEAVARYRAATTKPPLPEEARRFMVQAEALVRNQDPDRASCLYIVALDLAPWWPEGHYNLALHLAALDEFDGAMVEMKRYLALSPDAPDARAAQDKIYEWEVKVR